MGGENKMMVAGHWKKVNGKRVWVKPYKKNTHRTVKVASLKGVEKLLRSGHYGIKQLYDRTYEDYDETLVIDFNFGGNKITIEPNTTKEVSEKQMNNDLQTIIELLKTHIGISETQVDNNGITYEDYNNEIVIDFNKITHKIIIQEEEFL